MTSTSANRQRRSVSRRIAARFGWRAMVYYWLRKGFGSRLIEKGSALYMTPRWVGDFFILTFLLGFSIGHAQWIAALLIALRLYSRRFPLGRLVARVDKDTLTLWQPGYLWPQPRIQTPLATLRRVCITLPPYPVGGTGGSCNLAFSDGQEKTFKPLYSPLMWGAVCDFLRRKLPPSVQFTVDVRVPGWSLRDPTARTASQASEQQPIS